MDKAELKNVILSCMERVIKFSLLHNLNIHSPIGGKYGELFVAYNLWSHEPKLGSERYKVEDVTKPGSSDIILANTKKRIEVKWGILHHRPEDPVVKRAEGIPFWGWGFSKGNQFKEGKFDYCILLAAEKDGACPKHIFVISLDEMTEYSMGGKRKSAVFTKGSFFIEFSENEDFYHKRKWHPQGPSALEESLFRNSKEYEMRWRKLKKNGLLS